MKYIRLLLSLVAPDVALIRGFCADRRAKTSV